MRRHFCRAWSYWPALVCVCGVGVVVAGFCAPGKVPGHLYTRIDRLALVSAGLLLVVCGAVMLACHPWRGAR